MTIALSSPANNAQSTIAVAHAIADTTVRLAPGYGAILAAKIAALGLPVISASAPLRFTLVARGGISDGQVIAGTSLIAVFQATGRSTDTLTGVTVAEGSTDQAFASGSVFAIFLTAGQIADIILSIQAVQASVVALQASVATLQAAPNFTGVPTAIAFLETGPATTTYSGNVVTKTYTSGLVVTTTYAAGGTTTIVYGSPVNRTKTITYGAGGTTTEAWS